MKHIKATRIVQNKIAVHADDMKRRS